MSSTLTTRSSQCAVRREVPEEDSWRSVYLQKLVGCRVEAHYGADLEEVARLDGLIKSLVFF